MTTGILQLQTERLILQPLQDSSASELYKLMTDYDTAERAGFRPLNDESEAEGKVYGNGNSSTAFGIHPKGDENEDHHHEGKCRAHVQRAGNELSFDRIADQLKRTAAKLL